MRAGGVPAYAGEAPDVGGREEVDDGAEHLVGEHGEAPQRRLPPAAGRRVHRSGVLVGGSRWVEAGGGGRGPGGIRSQLCVLRIEIGRWELRCASGTSEAKTPKQGRRVPRVLAVWLFIAGEPDSGPRRFRCCVGAAEQYRKYVSVSATRNSPEYATQIVPQFDESRSAKWKHA